MNITPVQAFDAYNETLKAGVIGALILVILIIALQIGLLWVMVKMFRAQFERGNAIADRAVESEKLHTAELGRVTSLLDATRTTYTTFAAKVDSFVDLVKSGIETVPRTTYELVKPSFLELSKSLETAAFDAGSNYKEIARLSASVEQKVGEVVISQNKINDNVAKIDPNIVKLTTSVNELSNLVTDLRKDFQLYRDELSKSTTTANTTLQASTEQLVTIGKTTERIETLVNEVKQRLPTNTPTPPASSTGEVSDSHVKQS